ncbi:putative cytochrome P450 E-class, group I [Podospora australis]|uniref:Cytochrome P450 E-class, group I n=1 Tax=Podospora australis TaxID=1536484 RepID=A0AAN6WMW4_9PEZI|nr:putative cytochrome P450 E-class, group I [Podospora australis]
MASIITLPFSYSVAIQATAFALIAICIYRRYLYPLKAIPGPPLASVSRLWHLRHILKGDQNLQLIALHDKHGHFIRLAHNEVSVSHPDAIKKILLQPLHKASWYKLTAIPDYRFQTPMSTTDPHRKKERSRPFAAGYGLSNVLRAEPQIDSVFSLFLSRLDEFSSTKTPVHLDDYFSFAAFDVVGEILFSSTFGFLEQNKDVGNAIANSLSLNAYAAVMGFFYWVHFALLGNPFVTWLNILPYGHLFTTTINALTKRFEEKRSDSRFDSAEHWFQAMEKSKGKVKWRDVQAAATGAVGAASDTISCAMQSFVYHMIRQPAQVSWQRVREEIEEAQREEGRCKNKVVSFADAQKLVYLQACLKEALRIFAPVPMTLPRVAGKGGVTIGDKHFPEGTILSVNPWVMHLSKEIWGEDAREFRPERWLWEKAATLERWFMPWGQGYNSCPGQHIARMEMSKLAATLVRDYDIRQVDPRKDWEWRAYFTVVPHSWPCYIKARDTDSR